MVVDDYLYDDEFFKANEKKINERFNYLKTVNLACEIKDILPEYDYKVMEICNRFENEQILQVLYYMIQNFNARKRGFPDLFVFNENISVGLGSSSVNATIVPKRLHGYVFL